jgi:hypothetical protein
MMVFQSPPPTDDVFVDGRVFKLAFVAVPPVPLPLPPPGFVAIYKSSIKSTLVLEVVPTWKHLSALLF